MTQLIFIGIAAGLAAALLFLSPASGTALAFPLFALTGLPIAIVGLGWSAIAAAIAAVAGAAVVFAVFPASMAALIFLALFGAPIVWLTRLAGLSRPADAATPGSGHEWYPLGRLLLHASVAVAVAVVAVGVVIGYQPEAMIKEAIAALGEWLSNVQTESPPPTAAEIEPMVRIYVAFLPLMTALLMVAIVVFDLWLASLVARASSRLQRPRDRLAAVALPNEILIGFAVAAVLAFLPGAFGEIAGVFAGAFLCGLVLVGLAVLHTLTLGMGGRIPLLVVVYTLVIFSGLPIVLFALLGAGESFLHLRARRLANRSPRI